jgi:hypothetical protein
MIFDGLPIKTHGYFQSMSNNQMVINQHSAQRPPSQP